MRYFNYASRLAGAAVLAMFLLCGHGVAVAGECDENIVHLRGDWGQTSFQVKVVEDRAEMEQGLMHVAHLPRGEGMLFVYPYPQYVVFWMKNTLIPLDMLFFDETGRLLNVHSRAIPGDLTHIEGKGDVFTVLEINGGLAELYGIGPGSEMRHPAYPQDSAVWACP